MVLGSRGYMGFRVQGVGPFGCYVVGFFGAEQ